MGILEKRRFKKFLCHVQGFDFDNPGAWNGTDPNKTTMNEVYAKFGLDANTADFTGHALALYRNDAYVLFFVLKKSPVRLIFVRRCRTNRGVGTSAVVSGFSSAQR